MKGDENKAWVSFFLAECKEEDGRKAFGHPKLALR